MMKKNRKLYNIILVACILMMSLSWFVAYNKTPREIIKSDTVVKSDTVWKDTVITKKELVPKLIVKTKTDTVFSKDGDTIPLVTESKVYEERLISGKDTADVQVFTKGINTSVDSLKMRLRTHTVTNTVEIVNTVKEEKKFWDRFHISLQGGYGYGFNYKGFEPYVGIGASFDL